MADPVLDCTGVGVRFGGVIALDGTDFRVEPGTITSIIGPNGAGKTTLFNAVTGFVPTVSGSIRFQGREIGRDQPWKRGHAGIIRTFQNLEIFANMTVLENVLTGSHRLVDYSFAAGLFKTPRYWREERRALDRAREKLAFVGLEHMADSPAGDLPFGNQRALELARALAAEPVLLLLDEPAAGLNIRETKRLAELILRIRDELGISIGLIEHDMDLIMNISDQIFVLSFGRIIAQGDPFAVQKNPDVVAAYLGEEEADAQA